MTETFFGELYNEAESGVSQAAIPAGDDYLGIVTRAEQHDDKMIFLTLQVQEGAQQGRDSDVSLYFPQPGDKRGTRVYFVKKVAGFMGYPDVKAAFLAADNAPTKTQAMELIASTLLNKTVRFSVNLRGEGDYAGTNELKETKAIQITDKVQVVAEASPNGEVADAPSPAPAPVVTTPSDVVPF